MIDLSPATAQETLETRNMCVTIQVCVCVHARAPAYVCWKHVFRKSLTCVCVCVGVCVLSDWWSEAHTHHQQGICEVCESGAVIPLSLPKQRPRLLIYSKSLKSAYYCSSSSPSPPLPQSPITSPPPHLKLATPLQRHTEIRLYTQSDGQQILAH